MPQTLTGSRDTVAADFKKIRAAATTGTISPAGAIRWAEHRAADGDITALDEMTGPPSEIRREWMAAARQPDLAAQLLDVLTRMVDQAVGGSQPGSQQAGDAYNNLFPEHYRRATVKPGSRLPGAQEYPPEPVIYPGEGQGRRDRRPVTSWDGYVTGAAEAEDPPGADDYDRIFPAWYRRRCPGGGD